MPGDPDVPLGLTQTYYRLFAPRLGLAWSPGWDSGWLKKLTGGPQKTSFRMGWGLLYDPVEELVLGKSMESRLSVEVPAFRTVFSTPPSLARTAPSPQPLQRHSEPAARRGGGFFVLPSHPAVRPVPPKLRSQYSVQYNLNIQRQVTPNLLLQIGYVGSQGHRLLATRDLNFADPQTCLDLHQIAGMNGDSSIDCGPFAEDSSSFFCLGPFPRA